MDLCGRVPSHEASQFGASIPHRVAECAATRYVVSGECFVTTYHVGRDGYSRIGWGENYKQWLTTTHRAAYTYFTGEQIPEGMTVDHRCRNRACVRREHLRLLTNEANASMTSRVGHYDPDWSCKSNHSPDRRRKRSGGKQSYCFDCRNERGRELYAERKSLNIRDNSAPEPC